MLELLAELNKVSRVWEPLMWYSLTFDALRFPEFPIKLYYNHNNPKHGSNAIIQTEYAKYISNVEAIIGLHRLTGQWKNAWLEDED